MPPHKQSAGLKKGPVVTIADRSVIAHPKVLGSIIEACEAENMTAFYEEGRSRVLELP